MDNIGVQGSHEDRGVPAAWKDREVLEVRKNREVPVAHRDREVPAAWKDREVPEACKDREAPEVRKNREVPAAQENREVPATQKPSQLNANAEAFKPFSEKALHLLGDVIFELINSEPDEQECIPDMFDCLSLAGYPNVDEDCAEQAIDALIEGLEDYGPIESPNDIEDLPLDQILLKIMHTLKRQENQEIKDP